MTLQLDRESLRLGKYTACYADLTPDQLQGLFWLLGEWSVRVRRDGTIGGNKARAQAAIDALREFHRKPLTLGEAQALMRDARATEDQCQWTTTIGNLRCKLPRGHAAKHQHPDVDPDGWSWGIWCNLTGYTTP